MTARLGLTLACKRTEIVGMSGRVPVTDRQSDNSGLGAIAMWITFIRLSGTMILVCMLAALACDCPGAPLMLYVSPQGSDAWSGRLARPQHGDGPLGTLEGARDVLRALKKAGRLNEGAIVEILDGVYELKRPFELTEKDSGTPKARILYRAQHPSRACISGGRRVTNFEPVTDPAVLSRLDEAARGHVLQADLKALGITDFGQPLAERGRLELFFNDQPMTLARWPNEGFTKIAAVSTPDGQPVAGRQRSGVGSIFYDGDRPARWSSEKDIWLHGYWCWDWADSYAKVQSIDTERHLIHLAPPYHGYGYRSGQRFYALNVLAELDSPGEWYLDQRAGIIYFWPPGPIAEGRPMVSIQPALISLNSTSYVTVRGLVLQACRGTAITIAGGSHNRIVSCVIRNVGGGAVSISGGIANGVSGCDIYNIGGAGIWLNGGDRVTLTPAQHYADNNHIHHFARLYRTYHPAVGISGVGNRVSHNLIHDGPHNAILLSGNDHLIEYNEIYNVCYETGDVGAFYMGRDWTARGTLIRYNFFHDISGPGMYGANAVYLDDAASGTTIFGNIFYKAGRAAFIGGGRDNIIENNIFIDCTYAIHVDARGLGWMKAAVADDGVLVTRLKKMPYKQPPWSTRYQRLVNILSDDPAAPKGNVIVRNVCRGPWAEVEQAAGPYLTLQDNLVAEDPRFVNPEKMNFQLRDDSPAWALGFKRIPIKRIGLCSKKRRPSTLQ